MAKKDFTMKFPAPNVKGSQKNDNSEAAEIAKEKDVIDAGDNSGDTARQGPPNSAANSQSEPKDKKGKNIVSLLEQPKTKSTEFGENPFLQSKEHFDPASVIKTGYKMRVDYKTVLKLMAEIKKGYTIEALLDDALTMYLGNNPEAQKAIQMMRLMK